MAMMMQGFYWDCAIKEQKKGESWNFLSEIEQYTKLRVSTPSAVGLAFLRWYVAFQRMNWSDVNWSSGRTTPVI